MFPSIILYIRRALVFSAFFVFVSGCSTDLVGDVLDPTEPADQIYNQALANVDAGNYKEAIKKFNKVDRQHPYSPLARRSVVMVTYLSYQSGEYDQAIVDGERFVSLYPSDSEAPYALYIVGMSNFRQLQDVTRDQNFSRKTIKAMNEIITRYPDSDYVADARLKLIVANDQLAAHEMLIGRYYQERREFIAAINRFRVVVEDYQTTRHIEEALARLVESYYSLGLNIEAQTAAAVLGHNFADSEWYRYSYDLLRTGGLSPVDNDQSWISRSFRLIGISDDDTDTDSASDTDTTTPTQRPSISDNSDNSQDSQDTGSSTAGSSTGGSSTGGSPTSGSDDVRAPSWLSRAIDGFRPSNSDGDDQ